MSHKNYNKMYNNAPNDEEIKMENETEAVVEVSESQEEVAQTVTEKDVERVIEPAPIVEKTAVVTNCCKLNVRQHPDAKADVLTTLNVSDEVVVSINESVENYYRVCTAAGIEGYCVKDYLKIK